MKIYHSVIKLRAPTKFKEHTYHELAIQIRKYYMLSLYQQLDKDLTGDWSEDTDYLMRVCEDKQSEIDLVREDAKVLAEDMIKFLNDLVHPEMYGHIIPLEVRKKAVELRKSVQSSYLVD